MINAFERTWQEALHIGDATRLLIICVRLSGCITPESVAMGRSGYTCVRHVFCTLNVLMWVSDGPHFDSGSNLFWVGSCLFTQASCHNATAVSALKIINQVSASSIHIPFSQPTISKNNDNVILPSPFRFFK